MSKKKIAHAKRSTKRAAQRPKKTALTREVGLQRNAESMRQVAS